MIEQNENYANVIISKKKGIGSIPGAREQAAMVCGEDGKIYLFGGLSQDRYNDMRAVEKPFGGKIFEHM